jgi:23S rRNA (cytosine1962-C5)-methyltransferase
MPYSKVFLKQGKEESLKRFHPWIFSGAIAHIDGRPDEGNVVEVYTSENKFIAMGHFEIGGIAVRVLSFDREPIDHAFWVRRLSAAYDVRKSMGLATDPANNVYRLVHGEGDHLSGLVVDIYARTAVVQAHSAGMHIYRTAIADALMEVMDGKIESVYYKSEDTVPSEAALLPENDYLKGDNVDDTVTECGLTFRVDLLKGQKTGFFIDQRENRMLLERFSGDRSVLNLFCYTGAFSVYALRGGARLVHSVDSSDRAINMTNENVKLNFPGDADDRRHTAYDDDAFKFLDRMSSDLYDLIVLDPPAFAKQRRSIKNALHGYRKLNAKAIEKIKPGGILFTFSCSQSVSKDDFRTAVFSAAAMSGRGVHILHQLTQAADHPVNIYHPEGEYLKGLVLHVE